MCVDHTGLALFPAFGAFRCVGRIAFPIYCFLLVQGFLHTRNLLSYTRRLLLMAILSEIPFDLLIFGSRFGPMEQNVLFSLLLGLLALAACRHLSDQPIQALVVSATLAVCAMALRLSYGWLSVVLCLSFYFTRENRLCLFLSASGILLLYSFSLLFSGVARSWVLVSFCSLLSLPPILIYNGRAGLRHPALTLAFYLSYPAHLLLLCLLRTLRIIPPYLLH